MKIHLRKRIGRLSSENEKRGKKLMSSLYLAYNNTRSKTQYEWLNLHIFETPKTNLERDHNKQTMMLAESIRAKRLIEQQTTNHGFVSNVKGKISFLDYFKKLADKKRDESEGNYGNWQSAYKHLKGYCKNHDYTFSQIDELFLEGFKQYLQGNIIQKGTKKLAVNSAQSYYSKIKAALREAFMNKMINDNPSERVKGMKLEETSRQFLTLEELQKLVITACDDELLKKAFLFSVLTGLRWSDVKALTWSKIKYSEASGWSLRYTQQKTKSAEILPISEQAIKLIGKRDDNEDIEIFKSLEYNNWMNSKLQKWVNKAGIKKKITFHCGRHSFATLQLTMNTDIYTVSKMLGHKNLKTTEIYSKVIDLKKIEAAHRMPDFLLI